MSDEQPVLASSPVHFAELSRRRFLGVSALAASVAALAAASPVLADAVVAATDTNPAFLALSRFLTGRADLDARIVARAWDALVAADSGFADKAGALAQAIHDANLADVNAFAASPLYADANHKATAIAAISAYYLGQVGEGSKAKLVSFEKALMFQPTAGVVVIPTYALGGPNYWGTLSVPND